jgi:dTDP-4-dehydrorhamnose reductase
MAQKVLVVGENSFIAKHLLTFDKVSYYNFNDVDLSKYDTVINCALNPLYKSKPYDESIDVDLSVGKRTCDSGLHYIMLSTSKVYGNSHELKTYAEEDECFPYDYHSENKLITEQKLLTNYSQQTTILRGSNIFGYEPGRDSFTGYCIKQLIENNSIELTIDKNTIRDFLPVEVAADIIKRVVEYQPTGIYNLSSGDGITVGDFIYILMSGYNMNGKIIYKDSKPDRQFILNNKKLFNRIMIAYDNKNIYTKIQDIGILCKI